jgi:hypothetical protein
MSRSKKIALALALLAGLALLLKAPWQERGDSNKAPTKHASSPALQQSRLRATRDSSKLARALSLMAAQTLGLVQLQGRVLDQGSGEPIAFAEVVFSGPSGESSASCDGQGHFELEILPGFYRSYAQAAGYVAVAPAAAERVPQQDLASAVAMPRASIAPLAGLFRDHSAVDFYLNPGATLRARVIDESGRPISGAVVAAESSMRLQLLSGTDVSETDASGLATLQVPAGTTRLRAQHADFAGARDTSAVHLSQGEQAQVDVVLEKGCIIEGTVVHASGTPALEGAFEKKQADGSYVPVGTIEGGKIRFTQLHEGPVVLHAWPWKNPPTSDHSYECKAGSAWTNEVFVVPEAQARLSGEVLDQEGRRVPNAFVDAFALEAGATNQQERADAKGAFEFFALEDGPYQLSVYVPGKGGSVQFIEVPSTGVPMQLGGTGALMGSVDWLDRGSLTMRYRCDYQQHPDQAAQRDEVSMPMQSTLVLVENHHFRVEDVPACPLEGRLASAERSEPFSVRVTQHEDAVLHFP